jgi:hypothetical protein
VGRVDYPLRVCSPIPTPISPGPVPFQGLSLLPTELSQTLPLAGWLYHHKPWRPSGGPEW